jgi:hypothetical protein
VADVLADEIVARHRDEVAAADEAEAVEDLRHPHGDGGLAGAGVAGEGHVQRRRLCREAEAAADALDEKEGGDLADARLHGFEPDQVAVELVEDGVDAGFGALGDEVDTDGGVEGGRGLGGGFGGGDGVHGAAPVCPSSPARGEDSRRSRQVGARQSKGRDVGRLSSDRRAPP